MLQSSFISSSDARRYLLTVTTVVIVAVAAVCVFNWFGVSHGFADWRDLRLQRYQLAKLNTLQHADVVLVGDSSLANAIDTSAWSEETGKKVVSLPLTGDFGYEGSLNMMRRLLRHHHPRIVVIFQTLDIPVRQVSWKGLLYTAEKIADIRGIPTLQLLGGLTNLSISASILKNLPRGANFIDPELAKVGYPPQRPNGDPDPLPLEEQPLQISRINARKMRVLGEIGRLCQSRGVVCYYAHGPYVEPQCSLAANYVWVLNRTIERSGLRVVPGTPCCMKRAEAGDTEDHVAPRFKTKFSEAYRQRLGEVVGILKSAKRVTYSKHYRK